MDYDAWASKYAKIIKSWGFVSSIASGWVQDLINENPKADAGLAWTALYKVQNGR